MNRRKHANLVPVAALVRWVVAAFFLCTAGLCYVYVKNTMQTTGTEIRNLQDQLNALITQDYILQSQIHRLSSTDYLQKQLGRRIVGMIPIQDDQIVRIHGRPATASASPEGADELQPVSNRYLAQ
jgi:hypothetical protein